MVGAAIRPTRGRRPQRGAALTFEGHSLMQIRCFKGEINVGVSSCLLFIFSTKHLFLKIEMFGVWLQVVGLAYGAKWSGAGPIAV